MGETAVAMPRPADVSVGGASSREAPRIASPTVTPPNHLMPPQEDRLKIRETEEAALAATKREIDDAKARNKDKTETPDTKPPVKTAPSPSKPAPPPETPPPFTASQLADARAELQQAKNSGQGTGEQHAEAEQLLKNVEKQLGLTEKAVAPKVASVEKRVSSNIAAVRPEPVAKTSAETKVESGSKKSLLTKIKNLVEKIFSIPLAIWRSVTTWITK